MEEFLKIFENISAFDLIYIVFTLLSLIKCSRQGFVLSILAASKWLFAYVLTLFLFPKIKPYVKDVIDNEYVLDISLGILIFPDDTFSSPRINFNKVDLPAPFLPVRPILFFGFICKETFL